MAQSAPGKAHRKDISLASSGKFSRDRGNRVIAQTSPSFRQGAPESTDARDGQSWKAPSHYRTVG